MKEKIIKKVVDVLTNIFWWICKKIVRSQLKFDRFVIKRYLNVETPLYKLWWNAHAKCMQDKLDALYKPYKSN